MRDSIAIGNTIMSTSKLSFPESPHSAEGLPLTDREFEQFREFIYRNAGIALSPAKKALVVGRLSKRLKHHGLTSFSEYFRLLSSSGAQLEVQMAIDLLTTNETYFFREEKHFEYLSDVILKSRRRDRPFRVWSAACSSGEETYSIAMVLADQMGGGAWEIFGSDISTKVLERARSGLYAMERAGRIPADYLKRFCLKGSGAYDGSFLIERSLRERISFAQVNLITPLPDLGKFDLVFLRNVMIYFDADTKRRVVEQIVRLMQPDGYLFIGHSESLMGITQVVSMLRPSIYRRA